MYELFKRAVDTVKRMPPNLRFLVVVSAIVVIGGTALIYSWARSINYSVLYGALPPEDVGTVVDELERMNVPYRISSGGSSISVPDGKVGEIRVRLASAGLPTGGAIGYEVFDKSSMGMTEFVQKLNYRRALEGELTRTITGLTEVAAARVHIVIPEQKLFVEDEVPPTASVVLKLRAGNSLSQKKIHGITQLVASGVEGLQPDHVTVLDYSGNLLSASNSTDPSVTLSARQLDLQKSVEAYLQGKAQSLLDGVVGPGRSIVRVNAELNFEQVEQTIEEYDPDNLAIVSQEQNEETITDNSTTAEGGNSGSQTKRDNSIVNYEVNKEVKHIVAETGNIQKLTVSVIVDGKPGARVKGEEAAPALIPRSSEELQQLSSVVKNAVGFDDIRQDNFEIVSVPFDREYFRDEQEQLTSLEQRNYFMNIGTKALQIIGLIIALLIIRRVWKKTVRAIKSWVPPPPPPPPPAPKIVQDEVGEPLHLEKRKPKLSEQMTDVAKERPEEMAKVIRTLMID